jgi:hypothetical protein
MGPRKWLIVWAAVVDAAAAAPKRREGEARRPDRGQRARQTSMGTPGTWEAWVGAGKPQAKREGRPKRGATPSQESERPSRSDEVGERDPSGPCGAKAGAGITELLEGKMSGTPKPVDVSTKLQRIAELARQMPDRALTSLAYRIDIDWLSRDQNRTREIRPSGIAGRLQETAPMEELGTHPATERAVVETLLLRAHAPDFYPDIRTSGSVGVRARLRHGKPD